MNRCAGRRIVHFHGRPRRSGSELAVPIDGLFKMVEDVLAIHLLNRTNERSSRAERIFPGITKVSAIVVGSGEYRETNG